ncbi:hypothetical protein LY90DRAFT_169271 [Neocallimastix californiae]|uniref:Uncharacterized protein n=1 Tax=Neocallimastix californiae TaxID=1754190 RepID=A0A1Y2A6S3_9FUNG|nr:hypothetical protein LY90DRAFT_169271 [Neocallimastix californiae]|eukprot:ORY17735.1 hypothetical protein LY90DRAFT_169271 [Neocallimastix californiae]
MKKKITSQKVFSPKFDLIFKKLFIENGGSQYKYLIDLLNTIYNYDKKEKNGLRIRHIEFIKNMDPGVTNKFVLSGTNSLPSPVNTNKNNDKYFKTYNIFNGFSDPKLKENKPFSLDCVCYVSKKNLDHPSLELVSLSHSFILHMELRDRTEYNSLDIINYVNSQIKFQQIFYFQQNMYDLVSPQTPTSPSLSKRSFVKKIPNIRSLFFLKNQEVNAYPCFYHINPVVFDNSLQNGSINKESSSIQYFESSTINDLTTIVQLSKINDENVNIKDQSLIDWLKFINIGNNKGVLITEKSTININSFQDTTVRELASYLLDISNNNSITNKLLSTNSILHNMKVIEEKAKIESILRMLLVLTEDGLMSLDKAKNKAIKMYPSFADFIEDLTEKELHHRKSILDNNNLDSNFESDNESEDEWEIIKEDNNNNNMSNNNKIKGDNNNNNNNNNDNNNNDEKNEEENKFKRSSSFKLVFDSIRSSFSSNKVTKDDEEEKKKDNETDSNVEEEEVEMNPFKW